jgi:hypothetical protein
MCISEFAYILFQSDNFLKFLLQDPQLTFIRGMRTRLYICAATLKLPNYEQKGATCARMAFQALFDIGVRVTLITRVRSQTRGDGTEHHAGKLNYITYTYKRPRIPGGAEVASPSMFNMLSAV